MAGAAAGMAHRAAQQPSPLLELVSSQPEVATGILRWLCHRTPLADASRSMCALRATCAAFAQWEDTVQLVALLTGRRRPGELAAGGFACTYPSVVDAIDAAHGPRVPEDFETIAAAIRAAEEVAGCNKTRLAPI